MYECMSVSTVSDAVAQHHILLGQFQQHWVIKELVDTHIFTQTLYKQHNRLGLYRIGVQHYSAEYE